MNLKQSNRGVFGKALRTALFMSVLGLSLALVAGLADNGAEKVGDVAVTGWGAEASTAVTEGMTRLSPIALANACGMGASSCFRCHNGKRAAAPNMDAVKAPWHKQHAKVNNSCVGCHKGNARIMKEDLAHAKMLAKPHDDSAGACVSCHSSDLAKVQGAYHATAGAK